MKLPLAYYGDPILRKRAEAVIDIDDNIRMLVQHMTDTLVEDNGIGLAAPQVHHSIRLFITAVPVEKDDGDWEPGTLRVFINPEIVFVSKSLVEREEGCLSIPGIYADVARPDTVRVRATNLDGDTFEQEFTGLEARCILHENDHINGVLFIDRVHRNERKRLAKELKKVKKKFQN